LFYTHLLIFVDIQTAFVNIQPMDFNMNEPIHTARITSLAKDCPDGTQRIIYWMQQAQRVAYNHALSFAIDQANQRRIPLSVVFVLADDIPDANLRHYSFMLEGLFSTAKEIASIGLDFIIVFGDPVRILPVLAQPGTFLVTDTGYTSWQRDWRDKIGSVLPESCFCRIESDVVVPLRIASNKEEYAAATLRPKILRNLSEFLQPVVYPDYTVPPATKLALPSDIYSLPLLPGIKYSEFYAICLENIKLDASVMPIHGTSGGHENAHEHLRNFLENKLHLYSRSRNDPALEIQSGLSPWLHFGQISSLQIALEILRYCDISPDEAADMIRTKEHPDSLLSGLASFLEELIVRRELSCNFCQYNDAYDDFSSLPSWAKKTLYNHVSDPRPVIYSAEQLETAQTDDPYWNAAQKELIISGTMHNYMRMYWGKKILEWLPDPENAFHFALYLNNKYALDGRDPNSFAGVAWCFGKHDRPWSERQIFGSVRYMNAQGLRRKFSMERYLSRIDGSSAQ
jgi:deoxyribodipyrimidine photo-lyase